jgi:nucleoredoxin
MFAAMAFGVFAADAPETLTTQDLQGRPDRWPAEVTIKRFLNFGDATLNEGQKVTVIEYNGGSEVGVDAGDNQLFGIELTDCDLLEAANAQWATFTPAQKALEPKTVIEDASLWPARTKCTSGFVLNSGKEVPPNSEFELMTIEWNGQVILWEPEGKAKLAAQISQTDVVARARELVAIEPAQRPSRIANALKDVMVDAEGKSVAKEDIDQQTVFALYYGASWCGPCRSFSPGFVEYVNSVAADNPKLTVVLLSNDEQDADLFKYMKDEKMPFAAVPMSAMSSSGVLMSYLQGSIPQLTLVDRYGKILADSWNKSGYIGPKPVMAELDKSLKAGVAK